MEKEFNPKRVLMTGPVKIDESPYKVSNKKQFLSKDQLARFEESQAKRLNRAHNLLLKKRLNPDYFKSNLGESKSKIFNW